MSEKLISQVQEMIIVNPLHWIRLDPDGGWIVDQNS
jgi:hypothetical protein